MRIPFRLLYALIFGLAICFVLHVAHAQTRTDGAKAQTKIIRLGRLLDGKGHVLTNVVVTIEGDRVMHVSTGKITVPRGAEVIDLSGYTGLPGLIDVHTHMTYYYDAASNKSPLQQGFRPPGVVVFMAQENARKTLETGVTTVRDLGASDYNDIAMRDLINRGMMQGPRMFVAGYGLSKRRPGSNTSSRGAVSSSEEIERVIQQQVTAGADCIKLYGSTGSFNDVTGNQTFNFEEMKLAVEAAHKLGKRIAIHSYGPGGARDAVRAGTDSLEHGTDLDDETLNEMARRHIWYVPTIDHNRYYADSLDLYHFPTGSAENLQNFIQRNLETARRAHKAGVRFAMGSDAVFTGFGQNTRELAWFVKAGMTAEQALAAATTNGAALLGLEDQLGAVAAGYFADIVAVKGDPLTDINVIINHVAWVMKNGSVVVDKTKGH